MGLVDYSFNIYSLNLASAVIRFWCSSPLYHYPIKIYTICGYRNRRRHISECKTTRYPNESERFTESVDVEAGIQCSAHECPLLCLKGRPGQTASPIGLAYKYTDGELK